MIKTSNKFKAIVLASILFLIAYQADGHTGLRTAAGIACAWFALEWLLMVLTTIYVQKKIIAMKLEGKELPPELKEALAEVVRKMAKGENLEDCGDPECVVHGEEKKEQIKN